MLERRSYEMFARARARGVTQMEAYLQAGYKGKHRSNSTRVAHVPAVVERIRELREDALWSDADDLRPLIDELGRLAVRARKMDCPAALVAARGLIAEAARLKILQADRSSADVAAFRVVTPPRELTAEAWWAKHGDRD